MPHQSPRPARAGITWDAVRATGDLVDVALTHLGNRTGAVLVDGRTHTAYWLVAPHTTATWPAIENVTVLGKGTYVAVPAITTLRGRQPYWRVPPARDRFLTPTELLLRALETSDSLLDEWAGAPDHARRMATLRHRLDQNHHDAGTRDTRWAGQTASPGSA